MDVARTAVRLLTPGQDPQQSGFAGAVWAHQRDPLAGTYFESQPVQDRIGAEVFSDSLSA
jgi:hypothetical protein